MISNCQNQFCKCGEQSPTCLLRDFQLKSRQSLFYSLIPDSPVRCLTRLHTLVWSAVSTCEIWNLRDRFYTRICLIKQTNKKRQGQFWFDRVASNRKWSMLIEIKNLIQLALYLGNWMRCKKKSHQLCGVFCLTFIVTLVVFKNSCLTDYLSCVGLGK